MGWKEETDQDGNSHARWDDDRDDSGDDDGGNDGGNDSDGGEDSRGDDSGDVGREESAPAFDGDGGDQDGGGFDSSPVDQDTRDLFDRFSGGGDGERDQDANGVSVPEPFQMPEPQPLDVDPDVHQLFNHFDPSSSFRLAGPSPDDEPPQQPPFQVQATRSSLIDAGDRQVDQDHPAVRTQATARPGQPVERQTFVDQDHPLARTSASVDQNGAVTRDWSLDDVPAYQPSETARTDYGTSDPRDAGVMPPTPPSRPTEPAAAPVETPPQAQTPAPARAAPPAQTQQVASNAATTAATEAVRQGATPEQAAQTAATAAVSAALAVDRRSLVGESQDTQRAFREAFGDQAGAEWARQHGDELKRNLAVYGKAEPTAGAAPLPQYAERFGPAPDRRIGAAPATPLGGSPPPRAGAPSTAAPSSSTPAAASPSAAAGASPAPQGTATPLGYPSVTSTPGVDFLPSTPTGAREAGSTVGANPDRNTQPPPTAGEAGGPPLGTDAPAYNPPPGSPQAQALAADQQDVPPAGTTIGRVVNDEPLDIAITANFPRGIGPDGRPQAGLKLAVAESITKASQGSEAFLDAVASVAWYRENMNNHGQSEPPEMAPREYKDSWRGMWAAGEVGAPLIASLDRELTTQREDPAQAHDAWIKRGVVMPIGRTTETGERTGQPAGGPNGLPSLGPQAAPPRPQMTSPSLGARREPADIPLTNTDFLPDGAGARREQADIPLTNVDFLPSGAAARRPTNAEVEGDPLAVNPRVAAQQREIPLTPTDFLPAMPETGGRMPAPDALQTYPGRGPVTEGAPWMTRSARLLTRQWRTSGTPSVRTDMSNSTTSHPQARRQPRHRARFLRHRIPFSAHSLTRS